LIRNNQNRRRRGGNGNGPRPQQMNGGNNYGNRLDNRQRGNASQLLEKYRALARDAQQSGDRVTAEYYLQYADHYYRVLGDYREKTPADGRPRGQNFYEDDSAGYSANDDGDGDADEDQDGDRPDGRNEDNRSDNRSDIRSDSRGDEYRSQWRDDRGSQNASSTGNQAGNRSRDGQREPRADVRPEPRHEPRVENNRSDNRNDNRDRQSYSGNGAIRPRDENRNERPRDDNRSDRPRDENRTERPRDENRNERPRDENRGDRNINRDRRPDTQRSAQIEAPLEARPVEPKRVEPRVSEGGIPGLPGPATLRVKRAPDEDVSLRAERAPRAPRREPAAEPGVAPMLDMVTAVPTPTVAADVPGPDGEVVAPRRRGRPRKIVDTAPAES
jgi:hypothetical protein